MLRQEAKKLLVTHDLLGTARPTRTTITNRTVAPAIDLPQIGKLLFQKRRHGCMVALTSRAVGPLVRTCPARACPSRGFSCAHRDQRSGHSSQGKAIPSALHHRIRLRCREARSTSPPLALRGPRTGHTYSSGELRRGYRTPLNPPLARSSAWRAGTSRRPHERERGARLGPSMQVLEQK
jgi:hypothetical protein